MMEIKVNDKDYTIEYSFYSFEMMEDLDFEEMAKAQTRPFKLIKIIKLLLFGGLNHNKNVKVSQDVADAYLEQYIKDGGTIKDIFEKLFTLLEDSAFFKNHQESDNQ